MSDIMCSIPEAKKTILVVEDNDTNRRLFIFMLEHLGWTVSSARNGREALDMLSLSVFDVVLMDLQMPEIDGFEAIRRIRTQPSLAQNQSIPILAATAYSSNEHEKRCYEVGANGFLSKPVKLNDLAHALEGIVRA
jgi:CheY-like chemotaxis protein